MRGLRLGARHGLWRRGSRHAARSARRRDVRSVDGADHDRRLSSGRTVHRERATAGLYLASLAKRKFHGDAARQRDADRRLSAGRRPHRDVDGLKLDARRQPVHVEPGAFGRQLRRLTDDVRSTRRFRTRALGRAERTFHRDRRSGERARLDARRRRGVRRGRLVRGFELRAAGERKRERFGIRHRRGRKYHPRRRRAGRYVDQQRPDAGQRRHAVRCRAERILTDLARGEFFRHSEGHRNAGCDLGRRARLGGFLGHADGDHAWLAPLRAHVQYGELHGAHHRL